MNTTTRTHGPIKRFVVVPPAHESGWETMARTLAEQNSQLLDHIEALTKLLDDVIPNERRVKKRGD